MEQKTFEICPLAWLRASEKKPASVIAKLVFARPILRTGKMLTHLILTTNSPLRIVNLFSPSLQMTK